MVRFFHLWTILILQFAFSDWWPHCLPTLAAVATLGATALMTVQFALADITEGTIGSHTTLHSAGHSSRRTGGHTIHDTTVHTTGDAVEETTGNTSEDTFGGTTDGTAHDTTGDAAGESIDNDTIEDTRGGHSSRYGAGQSCPHTGGHTTQDITVHLRAFIKCVC